MCHEFGQLNVIYFISQDKNYLFAFIFKNNFKFERDDRYGSKIFSFELII